MASSITGCYIVSREWLYKCREMGKRVDDRQYTLAEPAVVEMDVDEPEPEPEPAPAPMPEPEPEPEYFGSVIIVGEREVARPQVQEDTISEQLDLCPPPPPPPHLRTSNDSSSLTPQNTTSQIPSLPLAESGGNPSSDNTRASMDPPSGRHGLERKSSSNVSGLSEILRNLSKDQLTAAHNKNQPGRSRGRLQGKAAAGKGRVFSRTPSAASSSGTQPSQALASSQALPSQALAYNIEETSLEKKLVRAKLDKTAPPLETPRALRNRVQKPSGAVDLTPVPRRSERKKEGRGAAGF
jgi:hypothetical protein